MVQFTYTGLTDSESHINWFDLMSPISMKPATIDVSWYDDVGVLKFTFTIVNTYSLLTLTSTFDVCIFKGATVTFQSNAARTN
jgi:hypothetical protein